MIHEHTKSRYQISLKRCRDVFNRMIRAEAGASTSPELCVSGGRVISKASPLGMVVCVTCGRTGFWKGDGIQSGHFLGSSWQSIAFEETCCHPQCEICNNQSGMSDLYVLYMAHAYPPGEAERLRSLKKSRVSFDRFELDEKRIGYNKRFEVAVKAMDSVTMEQA